MPMAVFPNFFRLAAPHTRQIYFAVPNGDPRAIRFKVLWHFETNIFNDILKNALARITPEYRKWHPGWEPLAYRVKWCNE